MTLNVIKGQKSNLKSIAYFSSPLAKRSMHRFVDLFAPLLERLSKAHPCESQDEAFVLLKAEWISVNLQVGASEELIRSIASRRLCLEHGWMGLGTRVAYQDQTHNHQIRTYLHVDGTIVIQRMAPGKEEVLFHLQGAPLVLRPELQMQRLWKFKPEVKKPDAEVLQDS